MKNLSVVVIMLIVLSSACSKKDMNEGISKGEISFQFTLHVDEFKSATPENLEEIHSIFISIKDEVYLDGVQIGETEFTRDGDFITSIDHVDLGIHTFSGIQNRGALNGDMDEFRIYNRALTVREVLALYQLNL